MVFQTPSRNDFMCNEPRMLDPTSNEIFPHPLWWALDPAPSDHRVSTCIRSNYATSLQSTGKCTAVFSPNC